MMVVVLIGAWFVFDVLLLCFGFYFSLLSPLYELE